MRQENVSRILRSMQMLGLRKLRCVSCLNTIRRGETIEGLDLHNYLVACGKDNLFIVSSSAVDYPSISEN